MPFQVFLIIFQTCFSVGNRRQTDLTQCSDWLSAVSLAPMCQQATQFALMHLCNPFSLLVSLGKTELGFKNILKHDANVGVLFTIIIIFDRLFGIVVSTSDCHPRGPGFDSQLYPRKSLIQTFESVGRANRA